MRSGKIADEAAQTDLEEISRRWKVESLAGIGEAWRDDRLWLLNALEESMTCAASTTISAVNEALRRTVYCVRSI